MKISGQDTQNNQGLYSARLHDKCSLFDNCQRQWVVFIRADQVKLNCLVSSSVKVSCQSIHARAFGWVITGLYKNVRLRGIESWAIFEQFEQQPSDLGCLCRHPTDVLTVHIETLEMAEQVNDRSMDKFESFYRDYTTPDEVVKGYADWVRNGYDSVSDPVSSAFFSPCWACTQCCATSHFLGACSVWDVHVLRRF